MANNKILDFKMGKDNIPLDSYSAEVYTPQPNPNINNTYSESPNVTQAKLNLQNELNKKSGSYQNNYASKINSILDKLSTNVTTNINNQPIREEYLSNLSRGSNETLNNLAKLSGGYGNTYDTAVADQQYQDGLTYINDINPALMDLRNRISQGEKQNLYNLLDALNTRENTEYGRYRNTKLDDQANIQRLTDIYLSSLQNDRNAFENDRNFAQGAYEFTEAQKQSAFEEYQDRLQSQVNQDNDNKLDVWNTTWNNYWKAQDINEANKQSEFQKKYNDYQLSERAKSIAAAKEAARKKAEAERKKAKEQNGTPFVYDPDKTFKDKGVSDFIKNHPMYENVYNTKKGDQIGYLGFDNFEDYLDSELDKFKYIVDDTEYKLSDNQKMQIMAHYNMNKDKYSKPNFSLLPGGNKSITPFWEK